MVERSKYKGHPVIILKRDGSDRYPFAFGIKKAKLIVENCLVIEQFVKEFDKGFNAGHARKAEKGRDTEKAYDSKPGVLKLPAFRNIDHEMIARLIALKPYCLSCDVSGGFMAEQSISLARAEAEKLIESDSPEILTHRLLFLLIIAELTRNDDPMPYREEAAKIGARLKETGRANPFVYYMKIVDQTTGVPSTNNFGDFTTLPGAAKKADDLIDSLTDKVLGFSTASLSGHAKKFLFTYTISDLIKECAL